MHHESIVNCRPLVAVHPVYRHVHWCKSFDSESACTKGSEFMRHSLQVCRPSNLCQVSTSLCLLNRDKPDVSPQISSNLRPFSPSLECNVELQLATTVLGTCSTNHRWMDICITASLHQCICACLHFYISFRYESWTPAASARPQDGTRQHPSHCCCTAMRWASCRVFHYGKLRSKKNARCFLPQDRKDAERRASALRARSMDRRQECKRPRGWSGGGRPSRNGACSRERGDRHRHA